MVVKSKFKDLLNTLGSLSKRNKYLKSSKDTIITDEVNVKARLLHPDNIRIKLNNIEEFLNNTYRLFTFTSDMIPPYKAGSVINIKYSINNISTSRCYSIINSYKKDNNEIKILVKRIENGLVSDYLFNDIKVGDEFDSILPVGNFTYNSIRDNNNVTAIAGGIGITPFLSFIDEINNNNLDINLSLIIGLRNIDEIFLTKIIESDKVKIHIVLSDEKNPQYDHGFINKDIISKYSSLNTTYFICGPRVMNDYVKNELKELEVLEKNIKVESYLGKIILDSYLDYPKESINKTYKLTINRGLRKDIIDIRYDESVMEALEKNNILINSVCRSGICGACHTQLLNGTVYVLNNKYIRHTDKELGFYHACTMYPTSNIEIKIPIKEENM